MQRRMKSMPVDGFLHKGACSHVGAGLWVGRGTAEYKCFLAVLASTSQTAEPMMAGVPLGPGSHPGTQRLLPSCL